MYILYLSRMELSNCYSRYTYLPSRLPDLHSTSSSENRILPNQRIHFFFYFFFFLLLVSPLGRCAGKWANQNRECSLTAARRPTYPLISQARVCYPIVPRVHASKSEYKPGCPWISSYITYLLRIALGVSDILDILDMAMESNTN